MATTDEVNKAGSETSRLVSNVSHVVAEWVTWFNRATAAQRTIDDMTLQAEMTSSRARDMLNILVDFDARSQGLCSLCVWRCCCVGNIRYSTNCLYEIPSFDLESECLNGSRHSPFGAWKFVKISSGDSWLPNLHCRKRNTFTVSYVTYLCLLTDVVVILHELALCWAVNTEPVYKWPFSSTLLLQASTYRHELLTTRLKFGERCFSHAGPRAWNTLSSCNSGLPWLHLK